MTTFACASCGGTCIQMTAWVYVNGPMVEPLGDSPTDQVWCPHCETDDTGTVEVNGASLPEDCHRCRETLPHDPEVLIPLPVQEAPDATL